MLIFVIFLVLAILLACVGIFIAHKESDVVILASLCIIAGIMFGLWAPVAGYTDYVPCGEYNLSKLSTSIYGINTYVEIRPNRTYTFKYESNEKTEEPNSFYTLKTVRNGNCEIIEGDFIVPYVSVYKSEGKPSIWSFALWNTTYKYVFHIPECTTYVFNENVK